MKSAERKLWMMLVESETVSHHAAREDILAAHYANVEIRLRLVHEYGVNLDVLGPPARDDVFRLIEAKRKKLEAEDKRNSDSAKYLHAVDAALKKWPEGGPELSKALEAALQKYGSSIPEQSRVQGSPEVRELPRVRVERLKGGRRTRA